jgi:hypothetical protein
MNVVCNLEHVRKALLKLSSDELHTLGSIGVRASQVMGWPYLSRRQLDLQGYIVLFHELCFELDFQSLLESSDEDFLHDISGVLTCLHAWKTGWVDFMPRCAKPYRGVHS